MREDQQKKNHLCANFFFFSHNRKFSVYKIRRFVGTINSNSLRIQQESSSSLEKKIIKNPIENLYLKVIKKNQSEKNVEKVKMLVNIEKNLVNEKFILKIQNDNCFSFDGGLLISSTTQKI